MASSQRKSAGEAGSSTRKSLPANSVWSAKPQLERRWAAPAATGNGPESENGNNDSTYHNAAPAQSRRRHRLSIFTGNTGESPTPGLHGGPRIGRWPTRSSGEVESRRTRTAGGRPAMTGFVVESFTPMAKN